MSRSEPTRRIPGAAILGEVREAYRSAYRDQIGDQDTQVVIVRFEAVAATAPPGWATRMQAAEVSAEQKVRIFGALGAEPITVVLPDTAQHQDLRRVIDDANHAPRVAGIIIQSPPPARLASALDDINPDKDLDALGVDSPHAACATADGIMRIAAPFLTETSTVAVVGSRGFVGAGVSTLLRQAGHTPLELELGDDLRQVRDADIVLSTTGAAGALTAEHIRPGHLLVVDSGFIPQPTGPIGDIGPDAVDIPRVITPVPGGIGPVEMAVLAERLTQRQISSELAAWRYNGIDTAAATFTSAQADVIDQQLGIDHPATGLEAEHLAVDYDDDLGLD